MFEQINKTLVFLIISTTVLVLSAVVICIAPIINNIEIEIEIDISGNTKTWSPSNWRNMNCAIFADQEKKYDVKLDEMQKFKKYKNLCYRQKAMYGLEYSAFIINSILAFICTDLTLLHYLNVGKDFEKKTGLIGLISGIIGFLITLIYVCYSGYIFNNDVAYGILESSNIGTTAPILYTPTNLLKLYPNGARYKWDNSNKYIAINENDKEENSEFLLYKDLGKKQYNYNSEYYEMYIKNDARGSSTNIECNIDKSFGGSLNSKIIDCDYLYYEPYDSVENKYIYDRWVASLILAVIIVVCNLILGFFGFLLFQNSEKTAPSTEHTPIQFKN